MPHRKPFVGGNWKMNTNRTSAKNLAEAVAMKSGKLTPTCDIAVFPPFPYLYEVGQGLKGSGVRLGAQDVSPHPDGAFTGEVSCAMLADLGVSIVLAGHSERRHVIGEDDDLVNAKTRAALTAGMEVILCLGETLNQRESDQAEQITLNQLKAGLSGISREQMNAITIAYEPVWAIGTGKTATPHDAEQMHACIRTKLSDLFDDTVANATRIQYGGSVKPQNASELFVQPNLDGGLIGGAALDPDNFHAIIVAATDSVAVLTKDYSA